MHAFTQISNDVATLHERMQMILNTITLLLYAALHDSRAEVLENT